MEQQYTQETQIMSFTEPKKVQTKYGEKDKWAFKDATGQWYNVWGLEHRPAIVAHSNKGDVVIISYQSSNWNGKEQRSFKGIVPVRAQEGQNSHSNTPQSGSDKDESNARAVALKASVEAYKQDWRQHVDEMLNWLKDEEKQLPSRPSEDDINVADIPF